MKFNEAQQAVLADYGDGKHAHLITQTQTQIYTAIGELDDPVPFALIDHLSNSSRPCELSAANSVLDQIQQEIRSRSI